MAFRARTSVLICRNSGSWRGRHREACMIRSFIVCRWAGRGTALDEVSRNAVYRGSSSLNRYQPVEGARRPMDRRRALKAIAVLPFGWAGLLGALPNRQPQTQPVDVPFSLQLAPHNLSAHLQRPVPLAVTLTNLTKASVGIRVPFTDETSHIFYQFLITDIAGHPVSNRVKTIITETRWAFCRTPTVTG